MLSKKKLLLPLLFVLSVFALTACGSAYIDALNPAIDEFNTVTSALNSQIDIVNADNAKFTDPQWVADTETQLALLRGAGKALKNLPAPDSDDYTRLSDLVGQLADAALAAADAYGAAITSGDISRMSDANPSMDKINELLPQINVEVDRLNQ